MMFCTKCGNQTEDNAGFCGHCGTPLPIASKRQCPQCGYVCENDLPFCSGCGAPLSVTDPAQSTMTPAPYAGVYAGFWMRFLAYIVDMMVAVLFMVALWIPLALSVGISTDFQKQIISMNAIAAPFLIFWITMMFFPWLYFTIFESSSWQGTPGKRIAGLLVTDNKGARIGFGQANIRYWSKILSGFMMIGYLMAAFTEKKQGLHDIIAGTLVLRR